MTLFWLGPRSGTTRISKIVDTYLKLQHALVIARTAFIIREAMGRWYSADSTTFWRGAHAPERKTTADELPSAHVDGSAQTGDSTLEDVEGAGEALVYYSDSITLDQKRDPCRLTKQMIATVVTIGGPGRWRTTTTYLKCLPRVRSVLARPRVVQPRRVRPCVRARRHAAARRPETRSSSSAGSGDSDGSGGDGSLPPLESYRPSDLAILLDLLQRSPGAPFNGDTPTFPNMSVDRSEYVVRPGPRSTDRAGDHLDALRSASWGRTVCRMRASTHRPSEASATGSASAKNSLGGSHGVTTSEIGDLRNHRRLDDWLDDWIQHPDTARQRKRGRALDRRTETHARANSALTDGHSTTSLQTARLCPDDPEGR
jgi:hypothetical protein